MESHPARRYPDAPFGLNVVATLLTAVPNAIAAVLWLTDSPIRSLSPLVALSVFALSLGSWVAWELMFGTAFAIFFPLHGARHIPQRQWLLGVANKQSLMVNTAGLVFSFVAGERAVFLDAGLLAISLTVYVSLTLTGLFDSLDAERDCKLR